MMENGAICTPAECVTDAVRLGMDVEEILPTSPTPVNGWEVGRNFDRSVLDGSGGDRKCTWTSCFLGCLGWSRLSDLERYSRLRFAVLDSIDTVSTDTGGSHSNFNNLG